MYGPPEELTSWTQHKKDLNELAVILTRPIVQELKRRENLLCPARKFLRTAEIRAMLAKIAEENPTCSVVVAAGEHKSCISVLRDTYETSYSSKSNCRAWRYMHKMLNDPLAVAVDQLQLFNALHTSNCPLREFLTQSPKLNLTREVIFLRDERPVNRDVLQRAEQLLRKTNILPCVYGLSVELPTMNERNELREIFTWPIYCELMVRENLLCRSRLKLRKAAIGDMIDRIAEANVLCHVQNPCNGFNISCISALRCFFKTTTTLGVEQYSALLYARVYMNGMINHPESVDPDKLTEFNELHTPNCPLRPFFTHDGSYVSYIETRPTFRFTIAGGCDCRENIREA